MNKRRKLLTGIGCGTVVAAWHKPVINSIVTPAHAQTSVVPLLPEELCPRIVTANVVFGPVSGTTTPPVCSATFDVLSGDASTTLTISSITTNTLTANVTVDVQDLGVATSSTGPRVVWRGPATDAPFCTDLEPTDDVVISVTATCDAAGGEEFIEDFLLSEILRGSVG